MSLGQLKHDYENRIKNLERALNAEQSRRRQYGFFNKQLSAQIKKLQVENAGFQKELNAVKKCSSCECLDMRRKQATSPERLQVSIPASRSALHASTNTLTPIDPEHPCEYENTFDIRYLQESNESLKRSVESLNTKLQKTIQEKVRETAEWEQKIREREEQINRLHVDLENLKRRNSTIRTQEMSSDIQVNSLLLERRQLLEKIRVLEERLNNSKEPRHIEASVGSIQQVYLSKSRCESCKRRFSSWDNLTKLGDVGWDRSRVSTGLETPTYETIEHLQQELELLRNKVKDQAKEFEAERVKMVTNEAVLMSEKEKMRSECEKLRRYCETLELELAKRRPFESTTRSSSSSRTRLFSSDSVNEQSTKETIQHLQNELYKAHRKIEQLEVSNKGKTINKDLKALRQQVDELELDKREFEQRLSDQDASLKQFEVDIQSLLNEKANYAKRCSELETAVNRKEEENEELSARFQDLQMKITETEKSHAEAVKVHVAQIETYQELLKQKDAERLLLIDQLCDNKSLAALFDPATSDSDQLAGAVKIPLEFIGKNFEGVKKNIVGLIDEKKKLEKEVESLNEELKSVRAVVERQNVALSAEMENKKKTAVALDLTNSTITEMQQKLNDSEKTIKSLQTELSKLTRECTHLNEELDKEKLASGSLKTTISNLEELLTDKNSELTTLAYQLQHANSDIYRLRTKNFDLETDLTVNSRELKGTRSKLERLKSKVKELEREARGSPLRVMSLPSPTLKTASLSPVLMSPPTNTS